MKKTSFVMLTWNRDSMLPISIEKLVNSIEMKKQCEILIYNNNSTDGTREILDTFKSTYSQEIDISIIHGEKNIGLNAYKILFAKAVGEYIVEVDDDILDFPKNVDSIFVKYFESFKNFGYLALDVIKNEHTTGAKPSDDNYIDITNGNLVIQKGPTGGWCTGFRRKDYKKISFIFNLFSHYNFKHGEDGFLSKLFRLVGKQSGIIKDVKCFHATGPYYSSYYNLLQRDIAKYNESGRGDLVDKYKSYE